MMRYALQPEVARLGPRIELVPDMTPVRGGMLLTSPMRLVDSRGRVFLIPSGFFTNFESVPSIARALVGWLLGDVFTTALAAVPHDYLYATHELPREEADQIFWELLGLLDPRTRRGPIANAVKWGSVRLFGWWYWRKGGQDAP